MTRRRGLLAGAGWLIVAISATAQEAAEPLTVVAQARPSPCYVGQSVELVVGVVADRDRPSVADPTVDGAEVGLARVEQVPISASAIGDSVWQRNLFRFRYRVVPRKAGTLTIPRVAARLGDRAGSSAPIRLVVREVPRTGRPATFLGGVGSFEIEANATPTTVRPGQTIDYRLTLRGPGARGVQAPPRSIGWRRCRSACASSVVPIRLNSSPLRTHLCSESDQLRPARRRCRR